VIVTARLDLIPATPPLIEAALAGSATLAEALGAEVPESWPHEFLDEPALQFMLRRLREGPRQHGWWLHFIVLRQAPCGTLIGSAGYKGQPAGGMVELGYGIVADQRRRGYASEAVRGLLGHAFAVPDVDRVIAETYPSLIGSIGVLETSGFQQIPGGSEPGVIRFQITRSEHSSTHRLPRPPESAEPRTRSHHGKPDVSNPRR
jgi:ribosomal-protein-alanine N-acetyltransferase